MLTIVMYHYVRDLRRSRFRRIKGLDTPAFDGQLDYLQRHYTLCALGDVLAFFRGEAELPPRPCVLSFDDGLIDHYANVFPRLVARGLTGCFFPPARSIEEHVVLDVHKIHFVLAQCTDPSALLAEVLQRVAHWRGEWDIPSDEALAREHAVPGRYDGPQVNMVKRLLQRALPPPVRQAIVDQLFARHVHEDETAFARELYVDVGQLRLMARMGMEIGGHGESHDWLETLPEARQQHEIDQTRQFLRRVHETDVHDWTMCYPHGSYNQTTLDLLAGSGCGLGLTTRVNLVTRESNPLELARLNTNDLPTEGDAEPCRWTRLVESASPKVARPLRRAG